MATLRPPSLTIQEQLDIVLDDCSLLHDKEEDYRQQKHIRSHGILSFSLSSRSANFFIDLGEQKHSIAQIRVYLSLRDYLNLN